MSLFQISQRVFLKRWIKMSLRRLILNAAGCRRENHFRTRHLMKRVNREQLPAFWEALRKRCAHLYTWTDFCVTIKEENVIPRLFVSDHSVISCFVQVQELQECDCDVIVLVYNHNSRYLSTTGTPRGLDFLRSQDPGIDFQFAAALSASSWDYILNSITSPLTQSVGCCAHGTFEPLRKSDPEQLTCSFFLKPAVIFARKLFSLTVKQKPATTFPRMSEFYDSTVILNIQKVKCEQIFTANCIFF